MRRDQGKRPRGKRAYMRFPNVSSERMLTSSDSGGSVLFEMSLDRIQERCSVAETVLVWIRREIVSFGRRRRKGDDKDENEPMESAEKAMKKRRSRESVS